MGERAELLDEMERSLLFAEACADVLDLRALLGRAGACLIDDVQADVAAVLLPARSGALPVVHYTSRRAVLPEEERSLREEAALALRHHRAGDGGAVVLARDADVDPIWDGPGDGPLYPLATRPLVAGGEQVGVLLLLARVDWILSPRTTSRIDRAATVLARALGQAIEVERLRASAAEAVRAAAVSAPA